MLGAGLPVRAQGPVSGHDKVIVRSPRPINLETGMITFGAPITTETRPLILEYLVTRLPP